MTYCASDLHGYYDLFLRLLDEIRFTDQDRMFILGDVVDKGPDSVKLLQLVLSMLNVTMIMGNHEYDFLNFYRSLLKQNMDEGQILSKLQERFRDGALLDWETVRRLEKLDYFVKEPQWIGVHAGVPVVNGKLADPETVSEDWLVNDRNLKDPSVIPRGSRCVLYGHTPVRYITDEDRILFCPRYKELAGSPHITDYCKIHLDLGTYIFGVMGCVRVEDCRTFYVQQDLSLGV
ncbi:MAG: metallophosphoesterase [Clostridia bacterium]|nr:metallophosphoesterase [Clostridia bacterium]